MKPAVQPSREEVREELNAICAHERFARSGRLSQFLRFIVEQKLLGRDVNEQIIGVNVFGRKAGYDSGNDTIVRTEAVALRKRLDDYYRDNPSARVRISVLRGGYNPSFAWVNHKNGSGEVAEIVTLPEIPEARPESAREQAVVPPETVPIPDAKRFASHWRVVLAVTLVLAAIAAGLASLQLRQSAHLTGNHAIVVSEFVNNTGDSVFDGTLKQALTIQLEQSPFLNILSEAKIAATLKLMARSTRERLTEEVAQEVCQRSNSQALLVGSISRVGSPYLIAVKAVNCQTEDTLASAEAQAVNRDGVLNQVQHVGNELRRKLGESLASTEKFNKPLERATTSSLEALKAYTEGNRLVRRKGESDAIPYFQRAIELDRKFAGAYLALGTLYTNSGEVRLARGNLRKAFELRDRATEQERFQIMATYYLVVTGELEKSLAISRQWARIYPDDVIAHVDLSAEYYSMGEYEQSAAEGEQAIRIDPDNYSDYGNPFGAYCALNRLDKAKTIVEQARARGLDSSVNSLEYALAFLNGDEAEMRRQLSLAKGKPWIEDAVISAASDSEAYHGRLLAARELSEEAIGTAERKGEKETAALWKVNEALREAEFGNGARAREDANAAIRGGGERDVGALAALALARAGDSRQAKRIMARLDAQFPLDSYLQHYWFPTIRAAIELNQRNAEAAIEALQGKTAYDFGCPEQLGFGPMYPVYVRGEAYLKARRSQDAAVQFRNILAHRGLSQNFPFGSLAHLQLARALAMAGDVAGARKEYQDFFGLWKDADADIPILEQAKAEYGKWNRNSVH